MASGACWGRGGAAQRGEWLLNAMQWLQVLAGEKRGYSKRGGAAERGLGLLNTMQWLQVLAGGREGLLNAMQCFDPSSLINEAICINHIKANDHSLTSAQLAG